MKIRGYEFDGEMLELFMERLCDIFGGPYNCINKIKDIIYSGEDFCLSDINDIKYYRNKITELEKRNESLVSENDGYADDIMEYEKVLSVLGYDISNMDFSDDISTLHTL